MVGLAPAEYGVFARALRPNAAMPAAAKVLLQSELSTVSVEPEASTDKSKDVSLVLRPADAIAGRVHTSDGAGVPGATLFVSPSQAPFTPVRPATTDAQGRFSTDVPGTTSSVMVLVEAVGVGRRATRQATRKAEPLDVQLDPGSSGVLILESDIRDDYRNIFVYHDGAIDHWSALERWAQAHGEFGEPSQFRAPFMSPGSYRLCVTSGLRDALEVGFASQPADRCAEGYLPPRGELRLSVPLPAAAP